MYGFDVLRIIYENLYKNLTLFQNIHTERNSYYSSMYSPL